MDRYNIVIVGGGPAGSSCAWRLRDSGLSVLILDRKTFPRDKTCAGWVTPPVLDVLEFDQDDYRRGRVLQPITGFRTGMIGGEEVETDYDATVSFGIRRCEFDHYLLARSGAECRLGHAVKSLVRSGEGWVVNGEIAARVLVGAGGHFCPVARLLGAEPGQTRSVVTAQEVEFEIPPAQLDRVRVEPERPELFFCDDLKGYGWCFRKGDFLNIGLGRMNDRELTSHVSDFCEFLGERGKVGCDLPERFHGHAYRLYERFRPKLVGEAAVLIGDSAGLAYPQSGEGIRPAVESGLMAAEAIASADGAGLARSLETYRVRIAERFGTPRPRALSDWLPAAWLHFAAARLLEAHWFTRRVVLDKWFLHQSQPPLAPAGR